MRISNAFWLWKQISNADYMRITSVEYKCGFPVQISKADYKSEFQMWISNVEKVFLCEFSIHVFLFMRNY